MVTDITKVAVIGAGSWGTAVASLAARNVDTTIWARDPSLAAAIRDEHHNPRYLAGTTLPARLHATADLEEAVAGADVVVMGVPSHGFRDVLVAARAHLGAAVPIVSLAKGVEQATLRRMTEVVAEVLPGHPTGVLTGPNLAKEVVAGQPAASVIAMPDEAMCDVLQPIFTTETFRVYTNPDVIGCEVAGALKNVIAIAVGMAEGLGLGDNTKAALITRGLAELSRLGIALGGDPLTFAGLAGMGDLVATCSSPQSRNRTVGVGLGQGRTIEAIIEEMSMVAEGVKTSMAVVELAARHDVDLPISAQVVAVLYDGATAVEALSALLTRRIGRE